MEHDDEVKTYESALGQAVSMWQRGQHIPMDLFAELAEQGYDVPAMEARYFQYT